MFPNVYEKLREFHSPRVKDTLALILPKLDELKVNYIDGVMRCQVEIDLTWGLQPDETFFVKKELESAGWSVVIRAVTLDRDKLIVYVSY